MKIGLYAPDSKMVNIPLMKISTWHKQRGHETELYLHIFGNSYDKVYCSILYNYTKETPEILCSNVEYGGTGYDIKKRLLPEIEDMKVDYSIYSDCKYTIQRFSLGCIRSCSFCVVHEKEGSIRPCPALNKNPEGKWIEILDNNFFANPLWKEAIEILGAYNQPVNFHGIDARILTEEHAKALLSLKHKKQIHMAWDSPENNIDWKKIIKWIPAYQIMVYVLVGYWSTIEEDLYRVMQLKELGIDPFVMPYDKSNPYEQDFARWVNHKAIFKTIPWEIYKENRAGYHEIL